MRIKTRVTEMLGIDLPIFGAPMFLVSYPDLVVAVSEAGGLGCFPALNYRTIPELKDALAEIRSRTNKPIGVNIILFKQHNPNWPKQLEACLDAKVELIITSLGTPRSILSEVRAANAKVFCDVTTMKHAKLVAKSGADGLIAVAQGAGGHAGAISPFSLIPYIKEETGLATVAAGSISNGKQMAAAMALGADAVYVGTRLIATPEADAENEYQKLLLEAVPEDIEYTDRITGIHANWLKQSLAKLEQASDSLDNSSEGQYKKWKHIYSAGHGVAQIKELKPAKEIIKEMAKDYIHTIENIALP